MKQRSLALNVTGFLTYAAVAVFGWMQLPDPAARLPAGILLGAFGLLMLAEMLSRPASAWNKLLLGAQAALVTGLLLLEPGWGAFPILFFVLAVHAMVTLGRRAGLVWIGIFALVTAAVFSVHLGLPWGLLTTLPYATGYLFFSVFAYALAEAEAARQQSQDLVAQLSAREASLQQAHEQLRRYTAQAEALAVAQERERIARELHDTLGHRLTVAAVQLEGAQRLIPKDPDRAAHMVGTVREQVRAALSELRGAVAALRSPLDEGQPLEQALHNLALGFTAATGTVVHEDIPRGMPALSPAQRQTLYRTAQEGLTNVQRHAHASQAWLAATLEDDIVLRLADDGTGCAPERIDTGYGLRGLRERAAALGGELRVDARAGGGTELVLRLPVTMEENDG
jgi:signal transduction histidine kinase